jgi:asparagine synthase (glutamine-hydrolysing)
MCGIAGQIAGGMARGDMQRLVEAMTATLVHRGPDEDGFFSRDGVGLGMRRLSIIDVAGGHQPAASEDGAVQVVFNGEIYNFPELRRGLERRGHRLRSHSDTEVIAHLFEEAGTNAFAQLRGMFAVAVWDEARELLVLARDRLGKKPLYYARTRDGIVFGSEIKALLAADPTLAEPDPDALLPYLRYGFVPEPRTWYRRIRVVPPGHWLSFSGGDVHCEAFWTLELPDPEAPPRDPAIVREELDALLEEAVRIRLVSDVPLGVFLSGGLDSSTVVAYAARSGLRPLKTFTIGFDRDDWDESEDAKLVAERFATEHHVLTVTEGELAANLPQTVETLVRHHDQPFGDSSALPTYHVSRLAREHVKVTLGGDGGDELFAGYSAYRGRRFAELYGHLPPWLARTLIPQLAATLARHAPRGRGYEAQRVARILHHSALPFDDMYFSKGALSRERLRQLLGDGHEASVEDVDGWARDRDVGRVLRSTLPAVTKASYADLRFGLLNQMLVKVDRMSMANSLEVRLPLLDHRLVEYAFALPPELKLRGWQTKAILRDTVRDLLPPRAMSKRKQGFSVPLREWLRDGLSEMVGDYLEGAHARLPDAIDAGAVRAVLAEHRRGQADHGQLIWRLLTCAAWQELYLSRPPAAAAV